MSVPIEYQWILVEWRQESDRLRAAHEEAVAEAARLRRIYAEIIADAGRMADRLAMVESERDEAIATLAAIGGALDAAGVEVPAIVQDYPRCVVALAIEREEARECIAGLRRLVEQLRQEAERTGWGEECSDLIAASEWG